MRYISTRGEAPALGFEEVLLAGLARDGGLYVPETWPRLEAGEIAGLAGRRYQDVALAVMSRFTGGAIADSELRAIIEEAYASFGHEAVVPLVQSGPNEFILELFHGPTLAFKDVAMQVLARLMDRALAARGRRATIVGATSGDTGGAAIEAFRGREAIDIFILFPHGRVSDVQRRQMTTPSEANVHALAIEGTFDDCQNLVKALFNDLERRDRLQLAGVNSINWARIMAQVVYYFTSATALGSPHRKVAFTVPTGNFGDILAGYVASRMGLALSRLVIATNANDILARTLATGRYEPRGVAATLSPSMDIQISSNFERLLFDLCDRDPGRVRRLMQSQAQSGGFELSERERERLSAQFEAYAVSEAETVATIAEIERRSGLLIDPHTAVGVAAARKRPAERAAADGPSIVLATAHPAKFPAAIEAATGRAPGEPPQVARQRGLAERFEVLPNDYGGLARLIETRSRATGGGRP